MVFQKILISVFKFQEYIHRVGRTARGEGGKGHALLILRPEEVGFLRYLKQAKIPLNEFEFSWNKIADIQAQVMEVQSDMNILFTRASEFGASCVSEVIILPIS